MEKKISNIDNNGVLLLVKSKIGKFTSSLEKIGTFVLRNPSRVLELTAGQLAKEIRVSEASIVRFCKEIGFKGYTDFRLRLAKDLGADNQQPVPENITKSDTTLEVIHKIMITEQEDIKFTADMMNYDNMVQAINMIQRAKRIGIFAVGSSYVVAYDLHWHLSIYGKPTQVEVNQGAQLILANSLTPKDLAFAISLSGQSRVPVKALEIAQRNGVPTICLTQNPKAEIVNYSDCQLISYTKSYLKHDLATSSRISQLVMLDALCMAYAAADWDENARLLCQNNHYIREDQFGE